MTSQPKPNNQLHWTQKKQKAFIQWSPERQWFWEIVGCVSPNTMSINSTGRRGGVSDEPQYHLLRVGQQGPKGNLDVLAECVRKILGEIHESDHYLFQNMVVPREHTIHGCGFV